MPLTGLWSATRRRIWWLGAAYVLLIAILVVPGPQRHMIYLHSVRIPLRPHFDQPEKYGLAPGKTINIRIETSDHLHLGAWFTFAESYYHEAAFSSPDLVVNLTEKDVSHALQAHKVMVFFHGNAASRAQSHRVRFSSNWSSRANLNVLVIDYRGFADSEGIPSEEGVALDGRAAWDWLIKRGANPDNIVLFGQSLGTAVVAKVAHALSLEGVRPRGVVMSGAFTDLATLLETYNIAGWIPLLQPFQIVPFFFRVLDNVLLHKFKTISLFPQIDCPLLLIHGEDDFDINIAHSQRLFESVLEPYLEPYPFSLKELSQVQIANEEQRQMVLSISEKRRRQIDALVRETSIPGLGKLSQLDREGKGSIALIRSTWGGHNNVINYEGIMDVTRRMFHL